jgi:hypothetical protein
VSWHVNGERDREMELMVMFSNFSGTHPEGSYRKPPSRGNVGSRCGGILISSRGRASRMTCHHSPDHRLASSNPPPPENVRDRIDMSGRPTVVVERSVFPTSH